MKKILSILITLLTVSLSAVAVTVDTAVDLGALSLDTDYSLPSFKGYKATFTPTTSGVLTLSSTTTDDLAPYSDAACTKAVSYTKNTNYGAHNYDMNVTAGTTYYFFTSFVMNSNTTIRLTMAGKQEITLEGSSPELNGVFNVSNGGQISFNFNKAVSFTGATITIGGTTSKLPGQVSSSSIFFNDTKELIWNALQAGTIKPGDTFTITLSGVSMYSDKSILYDGTGTLTASFVVGKMPITLVSTENTSGDFLSYYTTNDNRGIVTFTFSGKVSAEKLSAIIKYGSLDKDPEGGYYYETIKPQLSEDSTTIIVNLQGKRRKVLDMITSGDTYDNIDLGLTGVFDQDGNYAYSSGSGSLGSYWYKYNYKEINANVVAEFNPSNGSDLSASSKSIEIWVSDEDKLSYDGIEFAYEADSKADTILVTNFTKAQDPDDATAKIITVTIPEAVKTAKNINVSFRNLQCADGTDYSNVLRAKYNAFIISRANPVAGATLDSLVAGQEVKIYTNKTATVDKLDITLTDTNPSEGDLTTLLSTTAVKSADGKYFSFTCPEKIRLEISHDYRLKAEAIDADGNAIGSDFITYIGHASVFRYSPILLSAITPDTLASVSNEEDLTITLQYDGLVKVTTPYTTVSTNPDTDGYALKWTITVPKATVVAAGETLSIPVLALDIDDNRVQGNIGYKDSNVLMLTYKIGGTVAIKEITSSSYTANSKSFTISGQRTNSSAKGIIITDGKKIIR